MSLGVQHHTVMRRDAPHRVTSRPGLGTVCRCTGSSRVCGHVSRGSGGRSESEQDCVGQSFPTPAPHLQAPLPGLCWWEGLTQPQPSRQGSPDHSGSPGLGLAKALSGGPSLQLPVTPGRKGQGRPLAVETGTWRPGRARAGPPVRESQLLPPRHLRGAEEPSHSGSRKRLPI